MAQVALAWVLSRTGICSPIVGATKLAQVDDAIAAIELRLTEAETRRLEEPYRVHPVLGHE
jgi:aryl-alcohol dehydrogenase-like predicted oxidoreductase